MCRKTRSQCPGSRRRLLRIPIPTPQESAISCACNTPDLSFSSRPYLYPRATCKFRVAAVIILPANSARNELSRTEAYEHEQLWDAHAGLPHRDSQVI